MASHSRVEVATRSAKRGYATIAIVVADLGVLMYGVLALLSPDQLVDGYEGYTDQPWSALGAANADTPDFILLLFRLLGAYNAAFAILAIAIAVTAFRRGERWAWWALLGGNTIAFLAPMTYDQIVGAIGPFEVLEFVALGAIYAALAVTAPFGRGAQSAGDARSSLSSERLSRS